jgi:4-amino-4-deoxy-L-arabinose transferase-like glycosyltransferase
LSNEVSWLLPFGLFGVALLALRSRLHWPVSEKHQALILWGGWLVTSTVFFSIAGFFHPYYLTTMGPPIAALVGIAIVELWRVRENHRWLGLVLIGLSAGITVLFEIINAAAFYSLPWWVPLQLGLFLIGLVLLLPLDITLGRASKIGLACVVAALLVTPAVWSGLTTLNTNGNENLPGAYGSEGMGGGRGGFAGSNNVGVDETLTNYLQANTQGMRYMLAVPSSQGGANYVLATGRGVLYLGGFSGQDPVETPESLSKLVAEGQLRYILMNGRGGFGGPGGGGQSNISNWVSTTCQPVNNISTGSAGGFRGGFGGTLYDCAG